MPSATKGKVCHIKVWQVSVNCWQGFVTPAFPVCAYQFRYKALTDVGLSPKISRAILLIAWDWIYDVTQWFRVFYL